MSTKKTVKSPLNPVLAKGTNIADAPAGQETSKALAPLGEPIVFDAAKGLQLVSLGEKMVLPPQFMRFPMARSKTGAYTGKIENFGDFVYRTRHLAVNVKHADAIQAATGRRPDIINPPERKEADTELNAIKSEFYKVANSWVSGFHARADVVVTRAKISQTARGFTMQSTATLVTEKTSVEEQLRAEIDSLKNQVKQLAAYAPPKTVKRIVKPHKPIEVGGEVTRSEATAPATAAEPVIA